MENISLVTKLKGSVNNQNLKKFNSLIITVKENKTNYFLSVTQQNSSKVNTYIKILSPTADDYISAGLIGQSGNMTEGYINPNNQYVGATITCAAGTQIELRNKYTIYGLEPGFNNNIPSFSISTEDLSYVPLISIRMSGYTGQQSVPTDTTLGLVGDISKLSYCAPTIRNIAANYSRSLNGNIDFLSTSSIENVGLMYCNIEGNLTSLINPALKILAIAGNSIQGDLESLFDENTLVCEALSIVNVSYCSKITVKRSTLNKLTNANVRVIYAGKTVIEDV